MKTYEELSDIFEEEFEGFREQLSEEMQPLKVLDIQEEKLYVPSRRDYFAAAVIQGFSSKYGPHFRPESVRTLVDEIIKAIDKEVY